MQDFVDQFQAASFMFAKFVLAALFNRAVDFFRACEHKFTRDGELFRNKIDPCGVCGR